MKDEATMQTNRKRRRTRPKPATEDALDIQVRELSEKIHKLRLSAQEGDAQFRKMLRAFKRWRKRVRRPILRPEHCSCAPAPLWLDPAPARPFANPFSADLAEGAALIGAM